MLNKPCLWYRGPGKTPVCTGFALLCFLLFAIVAVLVLGKDAVYLGAPLSLYRIIRKITPH